MQSQNTTPSAWDLLLAKWIEFAKSTAHLPPNPDGSPHRLAAATPHVITLQAHVHALADAAHLPAPERGIARDRAAVATDDAAHHLRVIFRDEPMPDALLELLEDARLAIAALERFNEQNPPIGHAPPEPT